MLCDIHTVIDLHKGKTWTTLTSEPITHAKTLTKCAVDLAYLGRGLFVELIPRQTPLSILPNRGEDNVQSVVIGELTEVEKQSFNLVQTTGLGINKGISSASEEAGHKPVMAEPKLSVSDRSKHDLPG